MSRAKFGRGADVIGWSLTLSLLVAVVTIGWVRLQDGEPASAAAVTATIAVDKTAQESWAAGQALMDCRRRREAEACAGGRGGAHCYKTRRALFADGILAQIKGLHHDRRAQLGLLLEKLRRCRGGEEAPELEALLDRPILDGR